MINLKLLDWEDFFQESNAYYTASNHNYPEGIGASILITPNQMIAVYNQKALDNTGNMVWGLGSHENTLEAIFSNIFNLNLQGNYLHKKKVLQSSIYGGVFNYIFVRLVNQIDNPLITIECPKFISTKEYEYLKIIDEKISLLGLNIVPRVTIYNYNPLDGDFSLGKEKELYTGITLSDALSYFKDRVISNNNYYIKNVKVEERPYIYFQSPKELLFTALNYNYAIILEKNVSKRHFLHYTNVFSGL